jgi:D-glycero-D-manno-heptose 1,7-bisphosphate phosphatase
MNNEKWVLLDRDGVINQDSPNYIKTPNEWIPIPGALTAISNLNKAGFKVAVVTNQSGVGRGLYTIETLNKIHEKMFCLARGAGAKIDAIYVCPHHPDDNCECRKPKPGMLHTFAKQNNIDFQQTKVYFIGDAIRDIQAGIEAGCTPILVKTGKGLQTLAKHKDKLNNVLVFDNLLNTTEYIIERERATQNEIFK